MSRYNEAKFSEDQVDAALCVWEWMLDNNDDGKSGHAVLHKLFGDVGYASMRSTAIQVGVTVEDCWLYLCRDDQDDLFDNFDWEFVPAVCRLLDWNAYVRNNQHMDGSMREDPEVMCAKLMALHALKVPS